jgi:hypothetical protein
MKRLLHTAFIALLLAFAGTLQSQDTRPAIVAKHISRPLNMDGKMSDPAWAQATAYSLELPLKIYSTQPESMQKTLGAALKEKGSVKLLWNDEYLFVGGSFEDSDVVAESKEDQTIHCTTGDLIEVFLKPETDTYYWEIYGTPHNKKTCIFYPGRGRHFLPSDLEYNYSDIIVKASVDGTLNNWRDKDAGWTVEVAIPVKKLTEFGAKFDNSSKWTILVARYNYSRYLPLKELSAFPILSNVYFHLIEEYARLNLEK